MKRISAASFIVEPDDLWQRRIARRYLAQAPSIASIGGEAVFVCPGAPGIRMPVNLVPWHDDPLASGDTWVRRAAMEKAGIEAEIIYPSFAWSLFAIEDERLQAACMRSYNNWVCDLRVAGPKRFHGAVMIPLGEAGAEELERCVQMSAKAVIAGAADQTQTRNVLNAAAAHALPVVLVRPGGATPLGGLATFAKESAALALQYADAGARLIVLGGEGGLAKNAVPVTGRMAAEGAAWGLLGNRANLDSGGDTAFLRDTAGALYRLGGKW